MRQGISGLGYVAPTGFKKERQMTAALQNASATWLRFLRRGRRRKARLVAREDAYAPIFQYVKEQKAAWLLHFIKNAPGILPNKEGSP